jgi:hypothetical protein
MAYLATIDLPALKEKRDGICRQPSAPSPPMVGYLALGPLYIRGA